MYSSIYGLALRCRTAETKEKSKETRQVNKTRATRSLNFPLFRADLNSPCKRLLLILLEAFDATKRRQLLSRIFHTIKNLHTPFQRSGPYVVIFIVVVVVIVG